MGSRGASASAKAKSGAALTTTVKKQLRDIATDYERITKELEKLKNEGVPSLSPRYNAVFDEWKEARRKMNELGVQTDKFEVRGWQVDKGATTAPAGYTWINNGESRFSDKFKQTLFPTIDIDSFTFKA